MLENHAHNRKKLALISDIHCNYKALEAFLAFLEENPVDGIICLGDYVTDGPYPDRTLALVRKMRDCWPCYLIRGNREDYLLDNLDNHRGWKPSSNTGALLYTLMHLSEEELAFLGSLPTEREILIEGCPALYICHGVPGRVRGNVMTEQGLRDRALGELPGRYLLGGHSHHQELYRKGEKTYINPGSLGLSIDGVGRRAQFAVLTEDSHEWRTEFFSIPYDVEGYLKDFKDSGVEEMGMTLSKAVQKSLVTGINYFYQCVMEVMGEASRMGVRDFGQVPESFWKQLEDEFEL